MGPNVERESGIRIATDCRCSDVAHIGAADQARKAAAQIQQRVELVDAHARLPVQVQKHGWVDVARASAHDQAPQWGEAHRRFDRTDR